MKTYLIVDDHAVVRSGVIYLLQDKYAPDIIHEAANGEAAMDLLQENAYDIIIMDVQMPNTDSLGLMEFIKANYAASKVLVYSMCSEKIYAKRFMKAGAMGFLSKEAPLQEVKKALDALLAGRMYISDAVAEVLAEDSFSGKKANPFEDLSKRELEIAQMLLAGQTLTEISQILNIQTSTVGTHKQRLFEKIGVTNLLELKDLATTYRL
ncbi:MAG: response regulator transcription factor [Ferruginibacter sp.]